MERERRSRMVQRGGTMPNNGRIQLQFREGGPFKETGVAGVSIVRAHPVLSPFYRAHRPAAVVCRLG